MKYQGTKSRDELECIGVIHPEDNVTADISPDLFDGPPIDGFVSVNYGEHDGSGEWIVDAVYNPETRQISQANIYADEEYASWPISEILALLVM